MIHCGFAAKSAVTLYRERCTQFGNIIFRFRNQIGVAITVGGTAYDCAAAPGACSIRAQLASGPDADAITAPFSFAAGLPAIDAALPPTG